MEEDGVRAYGMDQMDVSFDVYSFSSWLLTRDLNRPDTPVKCAG